MKDNFLNGAVIIMRGMQLHERFFEKDNRRNLFELDFKQPKRARLKQIASFKGVSFFSPKEEQFKCDICGKKLERLDAYTCSPKCAKQYKIKVRKARQKYRPYAKKNLIKAVKEFEKTLN